MACHAHDEEITMNDTNPYAAPVYVEEDSPGYDLRKIARLYIRLGVVLKWFVQLFVIWISAIVCACAIGLADYCGLLHSSLMSTIQVLVACVFVPAHLALIILAYYSVVVIIFSVFTLRYRAPAMLLFTLGAICFPFTILVMVLLRCRAAQILHDNDVEILSGKVYLTHIPAEEDY